MTLDYSRLEQPTYHFQEGENKRGHFYFKIKIEEGLSIRGLESYLKEKYYEIMGKRWAERGQLREELKPYFYHEDIRKALKNYDFEKGKIINNTGKSPIPRQRIEIWSKDDCWVVRENDYISDEDEDDFRAKKAKRREVSMSHFEKKLNVASDLWDRLESVTWDEKLSQINQGVQAAISIDENLDKETGETPELKADVNLNAEVEAGVETNLNIEDNKALATVQAMFMQPEFVELNKKLMDKTADELRKQRNSNE